jgi:hypothetical protein
LPAAGKEAASAASFLFRGYCGTRSKSGRRLCHTESSIAFVFIRRFNTRSVRGLAHRFDAKNFPPLAQHAEARDPVRFR